MSQHIGNGIYVSISMNGSDTPVTRPETDNAGLSSRDRSQHKGMFSFISCGCGCFRINNNNNNDDNDNDNFYYYY